ncbi:MAG: hypothetical protein WB992_13915, partial [Bryobacteraceae bacterium]
MALVFSQRFKVRLNRPAAFQKQNPNSIAWDPDDESLRVFNHAANAPVKVGHINRALGRQRVKFLRRKPAVPRDIGKHFFRGLAGEASDGSANNGPEGQNIFMDGYQVNDVARFAPVGGCGRLVCGEVGRMQYVTEKLILLRRKKSKSAIVDPFEAH